MYHSETKEYSFPFGNQHKEKPVGKGKGKKIKKLKNKKIKDFVEIGELEPLLYSPLHRHKMLEYIHVKSFMEKAICIVVGTFFFWP